LAGDEFVDQHDLFDQNANVTQGGGKQVDSVHFSRPSDVGRGRIPEFIRISVPPVQMQPDPSGYFDHLDPNSREFSCASMYAACRRTPDIRGRISGMKRSRASGVFIE